MNHFLTTSLRATTWASIFALLPAIGAQVADVRETADLNHFGDLGNDGARGPVALDGDFLAVRRFIFPSFGVQIFSNQDGVWGPEDTLTVAGQNSLTSYGGSLSLDGDTLAVGYSSAATSGFNSGQTHIYRRTAQGDWIEEAVLTASDGTAGDSFGSPALDGDRVLIGAAFENTTFSQEGAAYVFERTGNTWTEVAKLAATPPVEFERLGRSVALSGDLALLSSRSGARVFREVAGTWTEEAELTIPGVPGNQVEIDGGTLGLVQEFGARAFLFEQVAGSWTVVGDIQTSLALPGFIANSEIALENGRLMIGTGIIDSSSNSLLIGSWLAERTTSGWPSVASPFETRPPAESINSFGQRAVSHIAASGDRFASLLPGRTDSAGSGQGTILIHETAQTPPTEFCFGSGALTGCGVCPCGNESPANAFGGCLSSAGSAPQLYGGGLPRLARDTLRFDLRYATPNSFALLFSGDRQLPAMGPCPQGSGILGQPALDGLRCVGLNLIRHGTLPLNSGGHTDSAWGNEDSTATNGLVAQGNAAAGQTRHWQSFFRESIVAGCGTGLGTSQGVSVTFAP